MVDYINISDRKAWNIAVKSFSEFTPYQSFEWGEYKQKSNWHLLRLKATKSGCHAYVQITYKKIGPFFLGWIAGSIMGERCLFNRQELIDFIKTYTGTRFVYLRANFITALDPEFSLDLYSSGWQKCHVKMNSEYTLVADLGMDLSEIKKKFSGNWRKNLNRAMQRNIGIKKELLSRLDAGKIADLFSKFYQEKGVEMPGMSEIQVIQDVLGDQIVVAFSESDSRISGLRAYLHSGTTAIDFWAAATGEAKRNYTSHALLWLLIQDAVEKQLKEYDMSGIDPVKNPGVFQFKKGTRFRTIEKNGEWEIYNSTFFSLLFNRVLIRHI